MPKPPAAKVETEERPGGLLEVDSELVENIATLLRAQQRGMVLNLVADLYPADLARLLSHLPFDEARRLFRWMPPEQGSDVLAELDSAFRADLLEEERPQRLTALLDDLDTDDAADVLADLADEVALQVLPDLEAADDLRELLGYGEETAGGIMAREYVAVPIDWTVADVTEEVRRNAETVEEIYAVFVIDEAETLQGVITLKRLLLSQADARIDSVMNEDFISVTTDVDQEEVARIMERYDLVSLPVVDGVGRLVGRITIDDVVDVIRDEAEEDIQRMSGMSGDEEPTDSVMRITRGRLPWLLLGLVGAGLSGLVIGSFESALEQAVVLATFIPIVMAMAGNAGIQSSSIVVQGLASGDVWASDVWRRLGKEVLVALINGLVLAVLLSAFVLIAALGFDTVRLALTAGLSLFIVILLATCIGTTVPLFLHRFGVDPALATGPFITTSNDIIGLAVFFLLAAVLYL
jgi:magnesium transporter